MSSSNYSGQFGKPKEGHRGAQTKMQRLVKAAARWLILLCALAVASALAYVAGNGLSLLTQRRPAGRTAPVAETAPEEGAPTAETPPAPVSATVRHGLIEVLAVDPTLVVDLRYATANNFTGQPVYPMARCLLLEGTAHRLAEANAELHRQGLGIKIFDAYRPQRYQQQLWEACPPSRRVYLADPKKGSVHSRGAAVDLTLIDAQGADVPMPSGFDEFSVRARSNYAGASKVEIANRELLATVMKQHGFRRLSGEWWHFEDKATLNQPLLDIPFEEFSDTTTRSEQ